MRGEGQGDKTQKYTVAKVQVLSGAFSNTIFDIRTFTGIGKCMKLALVTDHSWPVWTSAVALERKFATEATVPNYLRDLIIGVFPVRVYIILPASLTMLTVPSL